ncbi:TonB-dependent receptor [Novosphingobium sp. M1R2S20]|uniref:TonB-dependent receptor n=1 Tax=Novosphingobium rhizovicinum TaxID=3228928 RepID=A0ABV3RCM7_9SPHN
MIYRGSSLTVSALALVAVSLMPGVSSAQSADTPPQAADQPSVSGEILVVAQRRAERLEDVPVSVTALSQEALVRAGVSRFDDIGEISPATRIERTGIFLQPTIRGISSSAVGTGQENNVAVYVDGFYQPNPNSIGADLVNISDIQVLKGPQGTLYGRNAMGGAILINTRDPSFNDVALDMGASYGNLNDIRLRAYTSTPIGEGLAAGVSVYYRTNDGYIRDISGVDAAGYKTFEVRAKLKGELSNDFSFTLGYVHNYKSDPRALAFSAQSEASLGQIPLPPLGPLRTDQRDLISVDVMPKFQIFGDEGNLKLEWDTSLGKLTSYTAYAHQHGSQQLDFDATKIAYISAPSIFNRSNFNQAIDFAAQLTPVVNLIVGGNYFWDSSKTPRGEAYIGGVLFTQQRTFLGTRAYAVYGDLTWQIGEGLYLGGGLRYSRERKTVSSEYTYNLITGPGTLAPRTGAVFSDVTPRATLRYEVADRTNVYLSYSEGFKSGTFNTIGQNALAIITPVNPEKVKAWEVGAKTAGRAFHAEIAAYYYDYRDLQVSSLQTVPGTPQPVTILGNAGLARIYGAEASVSAAITEAFNIRAAGAYTHARYRSFPNASVQLVVNGINVGNIEQDFSGLRLARAPDWTFNFGADYTVPIGEGKLVMTGNASYSSKYAPTIETFDPQTGKPRFYQAGYIQASASIQYSIPGDNLSIGVFAENLTDKQFRIQSTANGQATYDILSEPRTYGVRIGYKY